MKNIFVGNLNYQATEDEVRQLFEQFGTVERVSLITDRETGRPRGFGFVEMPNDEEADQAIENSDPIDTWRASRSSAWSRRRTIRLFSSKARRIRLSFWTSSANSGCSRMLARPSM